MTQHKGPREAFWKQFVSWLAFTGVCFFVSLLLIKNCSCFSGYYEKIVSFVNRKNQWLLFPIIFHFTVNSQT